MSDGCVCGTSRAPDNTLFVVDKVHEFILASMSIVTGHLVELSFLSTFRSLFSFLQLRALG